LADAVALIGRRTCSLDAVRTARSLRVELEAGLLERQPEVVEAARADLAPPVVEHFLVIT
jgi:hypothetical protein